MGIQNSHCAWVCFSPPAQEIKCVAMPKRWFVEPFVSLIIRAARRSGVRENSRSFSRRVILQTTGVLPSSTDRKCPELWDPGGYTLASGPVVRRTEEVCYTVAGSTYLVLRESHSGLHIPTNPTEQNHTTEANSLSSGPKAQYAVMLTKVRQWSISWAKTVQSASLQPNIQQPNCVEMANIEPQQTFSSLHAGIK
jgi:hypothetical protein